MAAFSAGTFGIRPASPMNVVGPIRTGADSLAVVAEEETNAALWTLVLEEAAEPVRLICAEPVAPDAPRPSAPALEFTRAGPGVACDEPPICPPPECPPLCEPLAWPPPPCEPPPCEPPPWLPRCAIADDDRNIARHTDAPKTKIARIKNCTANFAARFGAAGFIFAASLP